MSKINVKTFFRLCKVKVVGQAMDTTKNLVKIEARPDRRYFPVCHRCGNKEDSLLQAKNGKRS